MSAFKHLFFDLDRTLWDFETNSHETLLELHSRHGLAARGVGDAEHFITEYKRINELCWADYRVGKVTKAELRGMRFRKTLQFFNIDDDQLAEDFGNEYIALCPLKSKVFPNTYETLDYLAPKYQLHIITNGFEEVQHIKLREAKLTDYFDVLVVSEQVGEKKPHPAVFEFAMNQAKTNAAESLMIGDDLPVDILGAQNIGMEGVYFNPHELPHDEEPAYEIQDLIQLTEFL